MGGICGSHFFTLEAGTEWGRGNLVWWGRLRWFGTAPSPSSLVFSSSPWVLFSSVSLYVSSCFILSFDCVEIGIWANRNLLSFDLPTVFPAAKRSLFYWAFLFYFVYLFMDWFSCIFAVWLFFAYAIRHHQGSRTNGLGGVNLWRFNSVWICFNLVRNWLSWISTLYLVLYQMWAPWLGQ